MNESPAIEVKDLTKRFGSKVVVDRVSLSLARGRIHGFLGPNGSGKTTTIRMLCGLLTPDGGSGTCLGFDIRTRSDEIKRQVGYMTQRFGLYEDLSIEENLDFIARMYGVADRRARVAATLERLGLASRKDQLAGALSGGWKQRLALGACLLHDPALLLLDEPTAGVDPGARREFWDQIHALAGSGMTVLVSTHYMDEAERCHDLAYIAYGKLLVTGTAESVVAGSGLSTWVIEGEDLIGASRLLERNPAVAMVAPFGTALHVSGTDAVALAAALAALPPRPGRRVHEGRPGLEDVFIHLMKDADATASPRPSGGGSGTPPPGQAA